MVASLAVWKVARKAAKTAERLAVWKAARSVLTLVEQTVAWKAYDSAGSMELMTAVPRAVLTVVLWAALKAE
jgi:hypothetical protein